VISRIGRLIECGFGSFSSPHAPTYVAYRLLATAVSVVPLMMARPSGNNVISKGSFQNFRMKSLRRTDP